MFQISDNSSIRYREEISRPSKTLATIIWILQALLAVVFFVVGMTKLASAQTQIALFAKIGFGQWFRYVTGGLDVVCALLVLIPRTAGLAATLIGMTMIGAVEVDLAITGGSPIPAIILLIAAIAVTWYHELYLPWRP